MTNFFFGNMEKRKLKELIEHLNEKHRTVKFKPAWSQTTINFLDITVSLIDGKVTADLCKTNR